MPPYKQDISPTLPQRRGNRDADRTPILLRVGRGNDPGSLRSGHMVVVAGDGADIGRRPAPPPGWTAVVLSDRTVSGFHARITREESGCFIEDQDSTNGTLVDGRIAVGKTALREGAILFLGSEVLVFRTATAPEIAALETDLLAPFAPVATLSPAVALIAAKLRRLAPSPTEILLLGETGTGKEVFARAVHAASGRPGELMAINCAALPRELVESELFGYERGAHSTAKTRKPGLIEAADRGTLFLDELGEMPLDVQSKLLRFLQDRSYVPIGSTKALTADVRIITASSRSAESGAMPAIQEALLGRLGAQPISIPPLRHRLEDVGRLLAHFLDAATADGSGGGRGRPLEPEAFQALFLYGWPHNIRELQKVASEAELMSREAERIGFDHLPAAIVEALDLAETEGDDDDDAEDGAGEGRDSGPVVADEMAATLTPPGGAGRRRRRRPVPTDDELRSLMHRYSGNVTHVAKHLGRQWAVIWRCLRRYGIDPAEYRAGAQE